MSYRRNNVSVSVVIIMFLLMILLVVLCPPFHDDEKINQWAHDHNYEVTRIERRYFGTPFLFWGGKNVRIWEADLKRDMIIRKSYFRISPWGTVSQRWEDGSYEDN